MQSLREKQSLFAKNIAILITFAYTHPNVALTFGDFSRIDKKGHTEGSLQRLQSRLPCSALGFLQIRHCTHSSTGKTGAPRLTSEHFHWLEGEGLNLDHLIQSQVSFHWVISLFPKSQFQTMRRWKRRIVLSRTVNMPDNFGVLLWIAFQRLLSSV